MTKGSLVRLGLVVAFACSTAFGQTAVMPSYYGEYLPVARYEVDRIADGIAIGATILGVFTAVTHVEGLVKGLVEFVTGQAVEWSIKQLLSPGDVPKAVTLCVPVRRGGNEPFRASDVLLAMEVEGGPKLHPGRVIRLWHGSSATGPQDRVIILRGFQEAAIPSVAAYPFMSVPDFCSAALSSRWLAPDLKPLSTVGFVDHYTVVGGHAYAMLVTWDSSVIGDPSPDFMPVQVDGLDKVPALGSVVFVQGQPRKLSVDEYVSMRYLWGGSRTVRWALVPSSIEVWTGQEASDPEYTAPLMVADRDRFGNRIIVMRDPSLVFPQVILKQLSPSPQSPVPALPTSSATILFLLDVSGSMDDPAPGSSVRKIDAAKDALKTALQQLAASPGNEFGLLTFGGACETELVVDFTRDADAVATAIAPLQPGGKTPIELAIRRGAQILRDRPSAANLCLVLISDGMETCDGDPVRAARELNLQGTRGLSWLLEKVAGTAYAADSSTPIRLIVIGFDVEPTAQQQLEAIASAAQGTFHRAENIAQLVQALTKGATEIHYWEGEVGVGASAAPRTVVVVARRRIDPLWYVLGAMWGGVLVLAVVAVVAARRRQGTFARAMPGPPERGIPNAPWARLVQVGPKGAVWDLTKSVVTLGRAPSNDIVIHDLRVSGRHAQIERRGASAKIIDLGSTNGTLVNGKPVTAELLADGDVIGIGGTELEFRVG